MQYVKLLKKYGSRYFSFNAMRFTMGSIEYNINTEVFPSISNSKLFVFKNYIDPCRWLVNKLGYDELCSREFALALCDVRNPEPFYRIASITLPELMNSFWVNGVQHGIYTNRAPSGTYVADSVTIREVISDKDFSNMLMEVIDENCKSQSCKS